MASTVYVYILNSGNLNFHRIFVLEIALKFAIKLSLRHIRIAWNVCQTLLTNSLESPRFLNS